MFEWITSTVRTLGYAGVALLTFVENLFPPVPSELVIPLAGFVAAKGDLTLWGVIAAGAIGSLAGATAWYEVGRRVGERRLRAWAQRHGRWLTIDAADIDRAQQWFRRHGAAAVFIGRLVPGVRTFVSLPAGFAGMPLGRFLLYSTAGTLVWTAALAYAGVVLQANFTVVSDYIDAATNVLLIGLGVLLARRYLRCFNVKRSKASKESKASKGSEASRG
jgi:membrane protein DedA with SNARE-associated domain